MPQSLDRVEGFRHQQGGKWGVCESLVGLGFCCEKTAVPFFPACITLELLVLASRLASPGISDPVGRGPWRAAASGAALETDAY